MKKFNIRLLVALMCCGINAIHAQNTVPVIVANAEQEAFADVVQALGTLKANNSVTITSTVTELVTEIHYSDGQRVSQGDLMISMDATDELALLQEEQARLGEAQRQVKRLQPLAAQNATSKSAFDNQNSLVSVSEARIKGIQSQINKRLIKAPFDGVVGLLDISVGALAQPGVELATLDDDDTMKMDFSVPERYLSHLRQGLKINAQTQAFPGQMFHGEIASIDSRINPLTRSVLVRAIIQNQDRLLKPGLLMRIKLDTQPRTALLIPEEAITSTAGQQHVFKVSNNDSNTVVEKRLITIGTRYAGKIEVLSGLSSGDQVVIHGTLRIKPGSEVQVIAIKKGNETLTELLAQRNKNQPNET